MGLNALFAPDSPAIGSAVLEIIAESIAPGVIVIEKANDKIVYVNTRFKEITGFNPIGFSFKEYALNMAKVRNLNNGSFLYEQLPLIQALLNGRTTRNHEISLQRADGIKLTVLVNTKPLVNKKQEIIGAVGVFEDITELKVTEEALKASEGYYRTLFENSTEGYVVFEAIYGKDEQLVDLRYLAVNSAFKEQIGVNSIQPVGKTVRQFFPSLGSAWFQNIGKILSSRKPTHIANCNNDTGRFYDALCVPFSKDLLGCIFRDMTEYKKLEKELHGKERLAAIGATAGMVGHDIRNPLQAMLSDIYLIKEDLTSMPLCENCAKAQNCSGANTRHCITESLESLEENISYINKIVQDLQDFARPINPEYKDTDLSMILVKVFENVRLSDSIKLSIMIKDLEKFRTDPILLQRALSNLTTNAIQAMPQGGVLEITGKQMDNKIVIIITDTGVGIPEEIKPKLFTPMMTTKSKGQGFGLAVSKRLIEAMKGTISFESEKDKGTKFKIELPMSLPNN